MSQAQWDREAVQHAVEAAQGLANANHLFTHKWLIEAFGLPPEPADVPSHKKWEMRRDALTIKWRRALAKNHGIVVVSQRSHGYVVVPVREITDTVYESRRQGAMKELWDGATTLGYASISGLTQQEVTWRRDRQAAASSLYVMVRSSRARPPRPGIAAPDKVIEADGESAE